MGLRLFVGLTTISDALVVGYTDNALIVMDSNGGLREIYAHTIVLNDESKMTLLYRAKSWKINDS